MNKVALALLLTVAPATAALAAEPSVNGKWAVTQSNFKDQGKLDLRCSARTGHCLGKLEIGGGTYDLTGTLKGAILELTLFAPPTTEGYYTLNVDAGGKSIKGETVSSNNDKATFSASR